MGKNVTLSSYASYVGSLADEPNAHLGSLIASEEGIGIGTFSPKRGLVRWDDCEAAAVGSAESFGVAPDKNNTSIVAVYRNDGATAFYKSRTEVEQMRSALGDVLSAHGVALVETPRAPMPSYVVAQFLCAYLGGLPGHPKAQRSKGFHLSTALGVSSLGVHIPWTDVLWVDVSGGQVAKSKIGAEVAFGIAGALAAKGATNHSYVMVATKDGTRAVWEIERTDPMRVRAKIAPVLQSAGVPFRDDVPPAGSAPSAPVSIADELSKLADLLARGLLTEDEFAAQKAKLLG